MRRRLYFFIPSVTEAQHIVNELLVKRIPINHMHVIANDDIDILDLPEASMWQKNDIIHSLVVGFFIGGIIGIIAGIIAYYLLGVPFGGGLLATTIAGALLGAWCASMIGMTVPNTHLKQYSQYFDNGELMLMVDIPKERVEEIEALIHKRHPQVHFEGLEPTIPGFP